MTTISASHAFHAPASPAATAVVPMATSGHPGPTHTAECIDTAADNSIAEHLDAQGTADRGAPASPQDHGIDRRPTDLEACRMLLDELARSPEVELLVTAEQRAALKTRVRCLLLLEQAGRGGRREPGSVAVASPAAATGPAPRDVSPPRSRGTSWSVCATGAAAAVLVFAVCSLLVAS